MGDAVRSGHLHDGGTPLDELESAKENLHALADATSRRLATLAREAKDEEVAFLSRVDHLRDGVGGLNATLGALETRVGHVVRSTSGVGDRLRLADARRAAAEEARALATASYTSPSTAPKLSKRSPTSSTRSSTTPRVPRRRRDSRSVSSASRTTPSPKTARRWGAPAPKRTRRRRRPAASRAASIPTRPPPRAPRVRLAWRSLPTTSSAVDALENRLLSSFESAVRARA